MARIKNLTSHHHLISSGPDELSFSSPISAAPSFTSHPNITRRDFLRYTGASLFLLASGTAFGAVGVLAVRVWPAKDYTRVTLEYDNNLQFTTTLIKDPERLVVDLEGVQLNATLRDLATKIAPTDPYIKLLRAGQFKPNVVRLVLDLKTEVKPQVFTLKPVGEYGQRLVLDIYPANPPDPLMALLDKPVEQVPFSKSDEGKAEDKPAEKPAGKFESLKIEPSREETKSEAKKGKEPQVTRLVTIALDPGHGGEDPGAVGKGGSYEKTIVLSIGRKLKELIDAQPNMRSMLTRDGDYFVPLHVRVQKARRVQADLLVSIHADAFIKPHARGSSVFALSERRATSEAARWIAKNENDSDLIGGVNLNSKDTYLAKTLLDLSQTATINDSLKLGTAVLRELGGINTLHKDSVEQASFAVLKSPDVPSILIETAFISNPEEERKLRNDSYQDKMAHAILRGIKAYFAKNPPLAKANKLAKLD